MAKSRITWHSALARTLIGALGGFAAALAFTFGATSMLVAANAMSRPDATITAGMLAFVVWMIAVLAAFAVRSAARAASWVLGGGAGVALLGWLCVRLTASA